MNQRSKIILALAIVLSLVSVYLVLQPKEVVAQVLGIYLVYAGTCFMVPLIIAVSVGKGKFHNKAYQIASYILIALVMLSLAGNQMMNPNKNYNSLPSSLGQSIEYGNYCKKPTGQGGFLDGLEKRDFSLTKDFIIGSSGKAFKYRLERNFIIYETDPGKYRSINLDEYVICD